MSCPCGSRRVPKDDPFRGLAPRARAAAIRYEQHAQALLAVQEARLGRFELLLERLRGPCELSRHERDCVADYMDGKWKRPRNNPGKRPDLAMQKRVYETVRAALENGDLEKTAVGKAVKMYDITESMVRHLCRAEKRHGEKMRASFDKMMEKLKRAGMSNKS
jgi:hypothetical protein